MTESQPNAIHTADVPSPILVTDTEFNGDIQKVKVASNQTQTKTTASETSVHKDTGVRLKAGRVTVTPVPPPTSNKVTVLEPGSSRSSSESPFPRKQLPPIPDTETEAAMAATANNNQHNSMLAGGGYGPFLLEYSLMAEYAQLHKQKLPGVYVIPSALTPLVWNGMLFIRQGMYQGGVFTFSLNIPENYPDGDCPKLVFDYPVFHPLVDPKSGELDVKRAFPKWRRQHMWQVLLFARKVFYKIDTKSPWNDEAAQLYDQDIEAYKKRVLLSVQDSKTRTEKVNDTPSQDPHAIRFPDLDPVVREETKTEMLRIKVKPKAKHS